MRILVSNDDGYLAPGIAALATAMRRLGEVTVIAPEQNHSGASNSLTLSRPLSVNRVDERTWFVNGTPSDCVHVALTGLLDALCDSIPLVLLAIGGIPLPGGVTYVRLDLIKSRLLQSAVSLAGPAMNVLLAILCLAPLHPIFGWLDPATPLAEWTNPQIFLAAMGVLMVIAAVFNLLPIPPLDGFGAIAPFLPPAMVARLRQPQAQLIMLMVLFFIAMRFGIAGMAVEYVLVPLLRITGFDPVTFFAFPHAFDYVLFGG